MNEKLEKLTIEELAEIAAKMSADFSNEAGIILEATLAVLEKKMPEADFIRFCDKLAA